MFIPITLEEWHKGIEEVKKEYNSIVWCLMITGLEKEIAEVKASILQLDKYKKMVEEY